MNYPLHIQHKFPPGCLFYFCEGAGLNIVNLGIHLLIGWYEVYNDDLERTFAKCLTLTSTGTFKHYFDSQLNFEGSMFTMIEISR